MRSHYNTVNRHLPRRIHYHVQLNSISYIVSINIRPENRDYDKISYNWSGHFEFGRDRVCGVATRHFCAVTSHWRWGVSNHRPIDCLFKIEKYQIVAALPHTEGPARVTEVSPHKESVTRKVFPCHDVFSLFLTLNAYYVCHGNHQGYIYCIHLITTIKYIAWTRGHVFG